MRVPPPVLHYAPASGWVNDPLALTWHEGRYHLFFQYLPGTTEWGPGCQWGHATSEDLLTWDTGPVALVPDEVEDGVWSGNLVFSSTGEAVVFYTAIDEHDRESGRVRRATPTDASWTQWQKEEVVVRPPAGEEAIAFRDPFVYRDGDGWRMLVGGGLASGEAVAWMFTSPDLRSWSFAGRALSRHGDACGPEGGEWSGSVWECPVLVRVGGRTALVVSVWVSGVPQHLACAFVEEDGDRLVPGEFRRLSYGSSLYAASTFTDADGEPGLIAWLREVGDADAGWMGAHSLPYRVRLEGDSLVVAPPPAVATRRRGPVGPGELPAVADLEWSPGTGAWLEADTSFRVDAGEGTLRVTAGAYDVDLPWSGETLRLVLDGPVLEVFGRRGVLAVPVDSGTGRVDASDADALTVYPLG